MGAFLPRDPDGRLALLSANGRTFTYLLDLSTPLCVTCAREVEASQPGRMLRALVEKGGTRRRCAVCKLLTTPPWEWEALAEQEKANEPRRFF